METIREGYSTSEVKDAVRPLAQWQDPEVKSGSARSRGAPGDSQWFVACNGCRQLTQSVYGDGRMLSFFYSDGRHRMHLGDILVRIEQAFWVEHLLDLAHELDRGDRI
jgi:hypothetical protein